MPDKGHNTRTGLWTVIFSATSVVWPGALMLGYPGVMAPFWQHMFKVGDGPLGNIMFFMWLPVGVFMYLVGRWHQRYGTRVVNSLGAIICGMSLFIAAHASGIAMVYMWAFFHGIGTCAVYNPALTAAQNWYPERKGLVSGIVNLFFGIAAAGMVPVFRYLLQSLGYVGMHRVLVVMVLGVGLLASRFVVNPGHQASTPDQGTSLSVGEALRTRGFWFLWLTWAFQGAAGTSMVIFLTPFGLSKGFSLESAVRILMVFNLTNGLSRIFSGYLSDSLGRAFVMSMTFFAAAGAYFLLPHVGSPTAAEGLAAVAGFAFGTLITVTAPLVAECFGLKNFGAIFGITWSALGFVSGLIGPSLGGYLLDMTHGNFLILLSLLGLYSLISGVMVRLVVPPPCRSA